METYWDAAPFIGVVVAGEFTEGALDQLESLGFAVLHFPDETVIQAFDRIGMDAHFEEAAPDNELARRVRAWQALSQARRRLVSDALLDINAQEVRKFMLALKRAVTRRVKLIRVTPLHGTAFEWTLIAEAIKFIDQYDEQSAPKPVVKYEVDVCFNNEDRVFGEFKEKESAIEFLRPYRGSK